MRRVSELIDAVRGALSGATMDPAAELALAQEVVRVCADTRERLVRAIDLMRQGLRGEAMVVVDVRPTLTEIAAALADPVMQRWRKRCADRGLPVPQPIDPELVHELSEGVAEAEDPRIDQLMRRLRYQNLAHAPVHERLRTMWALRRIDPGSVREEDVRVFEQAALKELTDRLRKAVESDDAGDACAVRDELRRQDWSDRDIDARRATAESQCSALEARHAARRSGAALDGLEACVMRGDAAAAREALDRYEAIVMEVHALGGSMPEDVRGRASPLVQWVAERESADAQDRAGRDLVSRLEALALSAHATPLELERALLECDSAGLVVSDAMRESVERRILSERRRRVRVRAALVASAVLCIAGIAAGAGWWAVLLQREAQIAELVAASDAGLERGELDSAERALEEAVEAAPWMQGDASIAEAKSRIAAARAERADQDAAFERALETAGDPKAEAARIERGEAAARAARTPEQSLRAQQWITSHQAERARRQRAADSAFLAEVARLSGQLNALEADGGALESGLDAVDAEAERLSRDSSVSPDARLSLQQLTSRIGSLRDMNARERALRATKDREEDALASLVERAPESFIVALQQFIRNHPDSARVPDFKTAALREASWRDVMGLPELASGVAKSIDSGDSAERARVDGAIGKAIESNPPSPWAPGLKSVRELCMPQDRWAQLLEDLITLNPVMRLRMVELKDGTRHYYDESAKAPVEAPGGKRVYTAMVSPDGRTQPVSLDVAAIAFDGPSPQAAVCEELRPLVRGARANRSVSALLIAIERIRSSATMDPVLQAMLLERIMEEGAPGAPHLAAPMNAAIDALRRLQLGAIEWIVPCNPKARPESREASEVIRQSVDVAAWQKRHERRIADVRKWLTETRIQPIGMLDRDAAGTGTVRISGKAARKPPLRLYAVMDGPDGALRVRDIGSVGADGAATLDRASESLPAGTLLFGGKVESMPEPSGS